MYIAHKRDSGEEQPLFEHLYETAKIAAGFAKAFGREKTAYICGLLHDTGKYSKEFQDRIKNDGSLCDHSTAGAKILSKMNAAVGNILGYVITGHHSGLLNGGGWGAVGGDKSLYGRLKKEIPDFSDYSKEITPVMYPPMAEIAREITGTKTYGERDLGYYFSFLIRMIYSCLVDADFLDTERFMRGNVERGVDCSFECLEEKIVKHAYSFATDTYIKKKRRDILEECLEKAKEKPGVYKLTVPTGGGKTISSMAFALRHIKLNPQNRYRRIIYVIPFTSIIEQNAKVFSDILGEKYILEHHSNFDFNDKDETEFNVKKLAAENWDMPVIVTTNVQFFESIYGNKPSKLRKLHNIANSVIVLDEVQMLPVELLIPCVKALEELVNNYNCTAVLCSATQPGIDRFIDRNALRGEICSDISGLYEIFNKTRIKFIGNKKMDELAKQIIAENQCLVIVNTKRQAKSLYENIERMHGIKEDGVFHLSTYMCPAHRHDVIEKIKNRLKDGRQCIVISTSLIEAGVDVDFPVVYRAMCGLDSIIQAAGRCNRERLREIAYVYVFDFAEEEYKIKISSVYGNYLAQRQSITEILAKKHDDVSKPEAIKDYFDMLFLNIGLAGLDKMRIVERLNSGVGLKKDFIFDFEDIARDFKIIEDNMCSVIVGYNDDAIEKIKAIKYGYFGKEFLRSLQKYTVNLHEYEYRKLAEIGAIEEWGKNTAILKSREEYSDKVGIMIPVKLGEAEFV
ncbi:MAG: CRISPR-associated helicase Cas3' [Acetivibrionales bacterium]